MENNIENQIKKAFHNREIQPNPALWEMLETKLDVKEKKSKKTYFAYLAYASVFIGFILALVVFLNGSEKTKKEEFITKQKESPVLIKKKKVTKEITNPILITNRSVAVHPKKLPVKRIKASKKTILPSKNTILPKNINIAIKQNVPVNSSDKEISIHPKITNKKTLSDTEMDALLADAFNKIKEKDTTKKHLKIQKNDVLYALENEVNTPLKQKIIKTLIAGAQAVENHISNN